MTLSFWICTRNCSVSQKDCFTQSRVFQQFSISLYSIYSLYAYSKDDRLPYFTRCISWKRPASPWSPWGRWCRRCCCPPPWSWRSHRCPSAWGTCPRTSESSTGSRVHRWGTCPRTSVSSTWRWVHKWGTYCTRTSVSSTGSRIHRWGTCPRPSESSTGSRVHRWEEPVHVLQYQHSTGREAFEWAHCLLPAQDNSDHFVE